jgi:hypothetical protein
MEEDEVRPQQQPLDQQQQLQQHTTMLLPLQQQHQVLLSSSHSKELITQIITPSPYPHHNTGPTSSRFRNALSRITTHPRSDVEAWQVIITEAYACYRAILPMIHTINAETHAKLDWMESCYGALLFYFPYASTYYGTIVEMLLAQSARVGEEDGPLVDYGVEPSQRALMCEAKVEHIFRNVLGVEMNGSPVSATAAAAAATAVSQQDDTKHTTATSVLGGMCTSSVELWLLYIRKRTRDAHRHANTTMSPDERDGLIRDWTIKAYETAITHASFVVNNHVLWKQYLNYVKSWILNPATNTDHSLAQKQMLQLRSIYQRVAIHPMTGLDQLWQEYEVFERVQSEVLASALIAEFVPKYQHARSVYLDRNRVYNSADLQMDRLATPPVDELDEDYSARMGEEIRLLTLWKKRISYERTNPERLTPAELTVRVRQSFKEVACIMTLHPEVWHMWSTWELLASTPGDSDRVVVALDVLRLAQNHIVDCTLLAFAESQILELHTVTPSDCLQVMEQFLERSPNTLGFVLYQHMVRRYKGIPAARAVFAQARRVLRQPVDGKESRGDANAKKKEGTETEERSADPSDTAGEGANRESKDESKRWMVTNRLDPSVGSVHAAAGSQLKTEDHVKDGNDRSIPTKAGQITWQLYCSHANIEHRLNRSPETAARVFELGLRKHMAFLTKTPYVLRYAQLLLELQDTENLRALLTRAISACEAHGKRDAAIPLWDMALRFESTLSGSDPSNVAALYAAERRRRAALMGQDTEDVATGGMLGVSDKTSGNTTISEQLIRSDGYDVSSHIVSGLNRMVDMLEVVGFLGSGDNYIEYSTNKDGDEDATVSGGKSDASYQKRMKFQNLVASGLSVEAAIAEGASAAAGSKIITARERLQQAGASASTAQTHTNAMALIIQQSPDWLRPLLLLLPASKHRAAVLGKPLPHVTEMTLTALRQNQLPAERPSGDDNEAQYQVSKKRKSDAGGDSSDEDNGETGGGYGSQFRARQRARQLDAGQPNGIIADS